MKESGFAIYIEYPELDIYHINGLEFRMTCIACPEQYDVFDEEGIQVAYIRLRYGYLSVDIPDCDGETIYTHEFDDKWKGVFDNEEERFNYLYDIAKIIKESTIKHLSNDL